MTIQSKHVDVERYQRDGYLTAQAILSPEQLVTLRAESDRLLALCSDESERYHRRIEWERDHLRNEESAGMERVIRKLEPISDLSPIFTEFAYSPAIVESVGEILGGPVELFEDKLNLKLPGGSPYPWHQDWVCCWRAHTDELNGCLHVIPGSQLGKPMLPFKQGSRFEIDPAHVDTARSVAVPLKAGEMIYFDPYLLHFSDLNRSQSPRRAIIYTYNPARLGKVNEHRFPDDH
jgi:ectoine hydroxylase-related dioxygenase (phytanoyl-CoA dioxygenase family)